MDPQQQQQQQPLQAYDSVAATLSRNESDFPLIVNGQTLDICPRSRIHCQVIDFEVVPRDRTLKADEKQAVITRMKTYLKERTRVIALPRSKDVFSVFLKLYNIDQPIRFKGQPVIHDFLDVKEVKENLDQISSTRWVAELGYELKYLPYSKQQPFDSLKNECLFSFTYECSIAITTISLLIMRVLDDPQVCFTAI